MATFSRIGQPLNIDIKEWAAGANKAQAEVQNWQKQFVGVDLGNGNIVNAVVRQVVHMPTKRLLQNYILRHPLAYSSERVGQI